MGKTSIEWTDLTWNPTRGCSRVSQGCVNCYAERVALRFRDVGKPFHGFVRTQANGLPQWTGRVELIESKILEPLSWRKPARIFVNSMSDLFHEALPDSQRDNVFAVIQLTQRHTYQVLTKRQHVLLRYMADPGRLTAVAKAAAEMGYGEESMKFCWPPQNAWLGVSVENQETADARIPLLLRTPAARRFVSIEPLLSAVDLSQWLRGNKSYDATGAGIPGVIGNRSILHRRRGSNLEASSFDRREPAGDAAVLEGSRSDNQSGKIGFGRLPHSDVLRWDEASQSLRTPRRVDGEGPAGHSAFMAGEPQERETNRHASVEPGVPHSVGERDSCDSGSWPKGEGPIRRSEFLSKSHGSAGDENPGTGRETVPIEDRSDIQDKTGDGFGDHPSQELGAPSLDWLIVGGESGPGARPFDIAWARQTIQQCKAAGVACFVKQLGADPREQNDAAGPYQAFHHELELQDRKGGDMDEWPEDLRVREFPEARA